MNILRQLGKRRVFSTREKLYQLFKPKEIFAHAYTIYEYFDIKKLLYLINIFHIFTRFQIVSLSKMQWLCFSE